MRAWWLALGTGLIGCAANLPAQPEERAAPVMAQSAIPEVVRAALPEWRTVEPSWFAGSEVWLVAGFEEDSYPCVPRGDDLVMFTRHAFTPRRVLRGEVKARAIDVRAMDLKGGNFPRALAEGREYLVLLRPSADTRSVLADPQGMFSMATALGPDEVVAVVDLSQTETEARDEATAAHRSGTRDGFEFSPTVWAAARDAATVTREQHAGLAGFIAATLLARPGATTAEVRAWLGAPDTEERWSGGRLVYRYWLSRTNYSAPVDKGVYGQVELQMVGGKLVRGSINYFRWVFRPMEQASIEIPEAELQGLGLAAYRLVER